MTKRQSPRFCLFIFWVLFIGLLVFIIVLMIWKSYRYLIICIFNSKGNLLSLHWFSLFATFSGSEHSQLVDKTDLMWTDIIRDMMASSNGNSDAELWCLLWSVRPNKWLSKQSWGWRFETPSRSLWRHCNGFLPKNPDQYCAMSQCLTAPNEKSILSSELHVYLYYRCCQTGFYCHIAHRTWLAWDRAVSWTLAWNGVGHESNRCKIPQRRHSW